MDRTWITSARRFSAAYVEGVENFMNFIRAEYGGPKSDVLCPCSSCMNSVTRPQSTVQNHLHLYGMSVTYTRWVHHGEAVNVNVIDYVEAADHHLDLPDAQVEEEEEVVVAEPVSLTNIETMLRNARAFRELSPAEEKRWARMLEQCNVAVTPGNKLSVFSAMVTFLQVKTSERMTNKSLDAMLAAFRKSFPDASELPHTYSKMKNFLRAVGIGYDMIHVCKNNCVLFRKDYANLSECPKCKSSRWKDGDAVKRIPHNVLRHFPITPRLQRLFHDAETREDVLWHSRNQEYRDQNVMSHPSHGSEWKSFNDKHKEFAADPRNIRLGLASDGFNPFGHQSATYSMWPVLVIPYNMPPNVCTKESNYMMALLIPGPKSPGKDFDLFMEPLVEELQQLWKGVLTRDLYSSPPADFFLRAVIIWCIHDYPALGTMSGRTTHGYNACVRCDRNPLSYAILSKICYIGHRRFLAKDKPHPRKYRRHVFNAKHENRDAPKRLTADELQVELEKVRHITPGNHPGNGSGKRKCGRVEERLLFTRRSTLWDLEYWKDLDLRHNLDVMHIEKNICDSIIGTLLNIEGKTKDTLKSRIDLTHLGIRKDLQVQDEGKPRDMAPAVYVLDKVKRKEFCEVLSRVRFPHGFASNPERRVSADGNKVQGLKTHDCHVLLQRVLPVILRGLGRPDLYRAVAELGQFFRELCSRNIRIDALERLRDKIPTILCDLEKIYPPAFFDVMVHLAVHLPDEALLRGPVQYGWMYPIERRLGTFKGYVRNRARPEGSIAEAYIATEALTFCSKYIETADQLSKEVGEDNPGLNVFDYSVRVTGKSRQEDKPKDLDKMVWYVLNNCPEILPYIK